MSPTPAEPSAPCPDLRALTRRYLELSNAGELQAIAGMFAEDATYGSTNVGGHRGRAAITRMMTEFFGRYEELAWETGPLIPVGDRSVAFDFTRRCRERGADASIEVRGHERLDFTDEGLIRHVEVEAPRG